MEQNEFVTHPIIKNYEASHDCVIRNRLFKKAVGVVTTGYIGFSTGGNKTYLCHRFIYECYYGLIKDGLVIDHINLGPKDNSLNYLRAVTQSQNCKFGNTGGGNNYARIIKSVNVETSEIILFHSIYTAAEYFNINRASVKRVTDNITKSACSKKFKQITFQYYTHQGR